MTNIIVVIYVIYYYIINAVIGYYTDYNSLWGWITSST